MCYELPKLPVTVVVMSCKLMMIYKKKPALICFSDVCFKVKTLHLPLLYCFLPLRLQDG